MFKSLVDHNAKLLICITNHNSNAHQVRGKKNSINVILHPIKRMGDTKNDAYATQSVDRYPIAYNGVQIHIGESSKSDDIYNSWGPICAIIIFCISSSPVLVKCTKKYSNKSNLLVDNFA